MDFKGKVAVITGGASGIGRAAALALAGLGTDIVIADIDDKRLDDVHKEIEAIGRRALAVHCDVSNNVQVDNLALQTITTMGKVDILMNNAGIAVYGNIDKTGIVDYENVLNINVLGTIRGVFAFLPHMLERGSGYIINTSSQAGFMCGRDPYSLSKYSLIGYSEGLYTYLRPKGIMVSVLCPALVNTNLRFNAHIVGNEQDKQTFFARYPAADAIAPEDVAQVLIKGIDDKKFFILTTGTEGHLNKALERGRDIRKCEDYLQNIINI
jgi:NAD(P)-dependent dehydrogenase (short-subunit alcohol dehydrogenase family)